MPWEPLPRLGCHSHTSARSLASLRVLFRNSFPFILLTRPIFGQFCPNCNGPAQPGVITGSVEDKITITVYLSSLLIASISAFNDSYSFAFAPRTGHRNSMDFWPPRKFCGNLKVGKRRSGRGHSSEWQPSWVGPSVPWAKIYKPSRLLISRAFSLSSSMSPGQSVKP